MSGTSNPSRRSGLGAIGSIHCFWRMTAIHRGQRSSRPRHDRDLQAALSRGDRSSVRSSAAAGAGDGRPRPFRPTPRPKNSGPFSTPSGWRTRTGSSAASPCAVSPRMGSPWRALTLCRRSRSPRKEFYWHPIGAEEFGPHGALGDLSFGRILRGRAPRLRAGREHAVAERRRRPESRPARLPARAAPPAPGPRTGCRSRPLGRHC